MKIRVDKIVKIYSSYSLLGIFFTICGPALFWLLYPLGPILAPVATEGIIHAIRYKSFKHIFREKDGFSVAKVSYLLSILPVSAMTLVVSVALYERVSREVLIGIGTVSSATFGFAWTSFVMSRRTRHSSEKTRSRKCGK